MNYQTLTTVIRNSGLRFICMILLNFQLFPKHSRIFVHSDLKCPFIKFSINNTYFNPIQDGQFWGWSRMNGGGEWRAKKPPSLKSVNISYNDETWQLYLTSRRSKKNMNLVTHTLSSADISIFSPEISKFCYIKKYRYRLHLGT